MTDKKTEELNEAELDQVNGGYVYLPEFKKVREAAVKTTSSKEILSSGHTGRIKDAKGIVSMDEGETI